MKSPGFDLSYHMGKLQGLYDAMGQCGRLPAGHETVTGIRVAIERQHAMLRQELADEEYNVGIVNAPLPSSPHIRVSRGGSNLLGQSCSIDTGMVTRAQQEARPCCTTTGDHGSER